MVDWSTNSFLISVILQMIHFVRKSFPISIFINPSNMGFCPQIVHYIYRHRPSQKYTWDFVRKSFPISIFINLTNMGFSPQIVHYTYRHWPSQKYKWDFVRKSCLFFIVLKPKIMGFCPQIVIYLYSDRHNGTHEIFSANRTLSLSISTVTKIQMGCSP